ncbi:ADP-ribosylation factor-like protein 13B [Lineus longissimus]|uniref:ADP-ribosylation factor-like protein 13B n=1 Tax=Lineus longissimus TaxID=88925 RepID=UPI002B4F6B72
MFGMMGNCMSWLKRRSKPGRQLTLGIFGIDNAGKTVTTRGLQGDTIDDVAPTVGFQNNDFKFDRYDITLYDLGGGKNIRPIWKNYYTEIYGIIYVIDSSQPDRIIETKEVLSELLENDKVERKPILILANKQDCEGALDELDICDSLGLEEIVNVHKCPCRVEMCSATLGQGKKLDRGIKMGFQWLLDRIDADYDDLHARISADVEKQQAIEAQQRKERAERVRKIREDREKKEAEERRLRGEPDPKDDEEDIDTGNPFQTINDYVTERTNPSEKKDSEKKVKEAPEENDENAVEATVSPRVSRIDSLTRSQEGDIIMQRQLNENSNHSVEPADPPVNPYLSQVKSKSVQRSGSPMPVTVGTPLGLSRSLDVDNDDDDDIGGAPMPRRLQSLDGGDQQPPEAGEKKKKKKKKKIKKNQTVPLVEEDEGLDGASPLPPLALGPPTNWQTPSPRSNRLEPLGGIQPRPSPRTTQSQSTFDGPPSHVSASAGMEKWGFAEDLPEVSSDIHMRRFGPNADNDDIMT